LAWLGREATTRSSLLPPGRCFGACWGRLLNPRWRVGDHAVPGLPLPGLASWLLPCALPALPTPRAVCLCPLKESPGLNLLTSGPVVGAERHGTSGRGVGRRETGLGKALPVEQRRRPPPRWHDQIITVAKGASPRLRSCEWRVARSAAERAQRT
jgi:hypothetical protein